jgi:hypothetical protein
MVLWRSIDTSSEFLSSRKLMLEVESSSLSGDDAVAAAAVVRRVTGEPIGPSAVTLVGVSTTVGGNGRAMLAGVAGFAGGSRDGSGVFLPRSFAAEAFSSSLESDIIALKFLSLAGAAAPSPRPGGKRPMISSSEELIKVIDSMTIRTHNENHRLGTKRITGEGNNYIIMSMTFNSKIEF